MERSTLFKLTAPLAVAALALSACSGAKPNGADASSSAAPTSASSSVSAPPTSESTDSTDATESTDSTESTESSQESESSPASGGTSAENDAAVDAVAKAYVQNNSGFQFTSASDVATQLRKTKELQAGTTFSPEVCADLVLRNAMSPENGFSTSTAISRASTTELAGFVQVNDASSWTSLKTMAERGIAECGTLEYSVGSQTASSVNTSFEVTVPGADAAWGSKEVVTLANGQTTTTYAGFAYKGTRGVNVAVAGDAASPEQVQELTTKAMQAWENQDTSS